MIRTLSRAMAISAITASALFSGMTPALAQGNWSWTDISDKIAERQNRPVWAMAYASPFWYLTDGQELWSGGHVWKTEGSVMSDITVDVRNAGISRVDDIVSDGQTVLFLKNVVQRNNSLEVLVYNGSFMSLTSIVRSQLNSDEGVLQVIGRNGMWFVVTTKSRLLKIDVNRTVMQVSLPLTAIVESNEVYNVNHGTGSTYKGVPVAIVPVMSNSWLVAVRTTDQNVHLYRYDGSSFTELNLPYGNFSLNGGFLKIVSNGNKAYIVTLPNGDARNLTNSMYASDGLSVTIVDNFRAPNLNDLRNNTYPTMTMTYNGSSWLILEGKSLYRFDGTNFESLGQTRDLFLTVAGNGNGTFLLGGAESNEFAGNNPSYPLTLKLAKAMENYLPGATQTNTNTNTYTGGTYTSAYGPNLTVSGSPSNFTVANGDTFTYALSASDSSGVNRTEIYANGVKIKTCDSTYCEFSAQYFTNGLSTRAVPFYGIAVDNQGNATQSPVQNLTINLNGTTSNTTNNTSNSTATTGNGGIQMWQWFEPSQSTIRRDQSVTYNVGTYDADGIKRIEIYVNGNVARTCDLGRAYGNQTCSTNIYGGNYSVGTNVAMNAKITDGTDQVAWTQLQNLAVTDVNGSNNTNTNTNTNTNSDGNSSVWVSSDPNISDVMTNQTVRFNVGAYDNDGIRRIDIFVNGSVNRTCDLGYSITGNYNCSYVIYGNSYSAGTVFYVNARITDGNGNMTWSDAKTYTIKSTGSTTPTPTPSPTPTTNGNGSSWTWSDPSVSEIKTNADVRFYVGAYDPDGIRRIELIVNGSVAQSCDLGYTASGNQQCSVVIHGSNYPAGSSVFVNAKITDGYGNVAWSDSKTYAIKALDTGTTPAQAWPTNGAGSVSITSNHDNGYANNETISFAAVASDVDGVAKIEILVNGDLVKTCTSVNSCGYTGGPYNDRNSVSYGVKMTDTKGNALYQGYKTIYKR